jgi:hypothetical protein
VSGVPIENERETGIFGGADVIGALHEFSKVGIRHRCAVDVERVDRLSLCRHLALVWVGIWNTKRE